MGSSAGGSMSHVSNMGSLAACSVNDTKPMQFPLSQRRKRRVLFTQHQVSDIRIVLIVFNHVSEAVWSPFHWCWRLQDVMNEIVFTSRWWAWAATTNYTYISQTNLVTENTNDLLDEMISFRLMIELNSNSFIHSFICSCCCLRHKWLHRTMHCCCRPMSGPIFLRRCVKMRSVAYF